MKPDIILFIKLTTYYTELPVGNIIHHL